MLTIEQTLEGDQLILAILESAMCGKKNERRISYEWHRMVPISAFPCIFVKAAVEAIAWMKILDSVKGMMMIIVRKQFGSQTCQPLCSLIASIATACNTVIVQEQNTLHEWHKMQQKNVHVKIFYFKIEQEEQLCILERNFYRNRQCCSACKQTKISCIILYYEKKKIERSLLVKAHHVS